MPEGKSHGQLDEQFRHLGGRVGDNLNSQNVQVDPLALDSDSDSDSDTSTTDQQRAAREREDEILKKAREEENLGNINKKREASTNPSSADDLSKDEHFQRNSGLSPKSVYSNSTTEIQLPYYKSMLDWKITGGPDMPTVYARVPTLSEMQTLRKRAWHLENQILQREVCCRVCDQTFVYGGSDVCNTSALMLRI